MALVTELMQWAASDAAEPPQEVSTQAVALACDFMDEYARPMAQRVYGDAALPQAERGAAQIARRIVKERHSRSEEHTSELQSLMRISYAVFCLKKKKKKPLRKI